MTIGLAVPASAAEAVKHYVVIDTVGNCSVIEGKVSTGKTPIGQESGYDSRDAAKQAFDELTKDEAQCEGVIG